MSYPIRTGCRFVFHRKLWERVRGSLRKFRCCGWETYECEVVRHSYGTLVGQHTFDLKVLRTSSGERKKGDLIRVKGRHLYPNIEKHRPGKEARAIVREQRAQWKRMLAA